MSDPEGTRKSGLISEKTRESDLTPEQRTQSPKYVFNTAFKEPVNSHITIHEYPLLEDDNKELDISTMIDPGIIDNPIRQSFNKIKTLFHDHIGERPKSMVSTYGLLYTTETEGIKNHLMSTLESIKTTEINNTNKLFITAQIKLLLNAVYLKLKYIADTTKLVQQLDVQIKELKSKEQTLKEELEKNKEELEKNTVTKQLLADAINVNRSNTSAISNAEATLTNLKAENQVLLDKLKQTQIDLEQSIATNTEIKTNSDHVLKSVPIGERGKLKTSIPAEEDFSHIQLIHPDQYPKLCQVFGLVTITGIGLKLVSFTPIQDTDIYSFLTIIIKNYSLNNLNVIKPKNLNKTNINSVWTALHNELILPKKTDNNNNDIIKIKIIILLSILILQAELDDSNRFVSSIIVNIPKIIDILNKVLHEHTSLAGIKLANTDHTHITSTITTALQILKDTDKAGKATNDIIQFKLIMIREYVRLTFNNRFLFPGGTQGYSTVNPNIKDLNPVSPQKNKYLKYKNKYLQLKKILNIN